MSIHKIQQFHLTAVYFWQKTLLFRTQQVRNSMTQLTLTFRNLFTYPPRIKSDVGRIVMLTFGISSSLFALFLRKMFSMYVVDFDF